MVLNPRWFAFLLVLEATTSTFASRAKDLKTSSTVHILVLVVRVCAFSTPSPHPANDRFNVTAEAHLQVLSELGVSQIQLDALAEAKGGISRDR